MKIYHVSDSHGNLHDLACAASGTHDVVVLTGDMFPNAWPWRGLEAEVDYQKRWFNHKKASIFRYLAGKPVILVNGNHDFTCLAELMVSGGYQGEVHKLEETKVLDFLGYRWSGHGYIPFIHGVWNNELRPVGLAVAADALFLHSNLDIVCTHAPPQGFLSGPWGCPSLASNYRQNPSAESVQLHLFGHVHEQGGENIRVGNARFYNSATTYQIIELP